MALKIEKLNKHFANGKHALQDIQLNIGEGEMVALIGASGSGKSTLLRMIAGLLPADEEAGSLIEVNGHCVQSGGRIASDIRTIRSQVGFVFQQFNLVDRLPVLVNVLVGRLHCMPMWRGVMRWFNAQERVLGLEALQRVGILDCHAQRASTLSGGQQQRAAIARALANDPALIIADEPTGNLDASNADAVFDLFLELRNQGKTLVMVTHNERLAQSASRLITLHAGRIHSNQYLLGVE